MAILTLKNNAFVLEMPKSTYAMGVDDDGVLVNVYWGKKLNNPEELYIKHKTLTDWIGNTELNFEYMPEFPGRCGLTFEESCLDATFSDGVRDVRFKYDSFKIEKCENTEILKILLKDEHYPLQAELVYVLYNGLDLISRYAVIKNTGNEKIKLHSFKSAAVYLPYGNDYQLMHFRGNWGMEFQREITDIPYGKTVFDTRRGSSAGPHHVPFFAAFEKNGATETMGDVWYGVLHWSGNFKICAEKNQANMVSITAGINDWMTEYTLKSGEEFVCPKLTIGFSDSGFEKITEQAYDLQFDFITPRAKAYDTRPVIYNSWYPYLFDVQRDNMIAFLDKCKYVGVELFVIDDGWMENRDDQYAGLGDWYTDKKKFPGGIKEISDAAHEKGLKFGLWFEPEMVSPTANLRKEHPDWVLSFPTRENTPMRDQYILNLANDEVMEFVWETADRLISENNLDYVKWDMNRYISEPGFVGGSDEDRESIYIKYTQNLYKVWERINKKYPKCLLECCAHGGARTDFGMVEYSDRMNRSDNADPVDVLKLNEGFTYLYLPKTAGGAGNISASPNNINGRVTPLEYRAHIGMTGAMSIGINLLKISQEETDEIKRYVEEFKEIRKITHDAYVYRIFSVLDKPYTVWQYTKRDKHEAVVFAFGNGLNWRQRIPPLKLRGLEPDTKYEVEGIGTFSGDTLMKFGIEIELFGDYASKVIVIKAV